MNPSSLKLIFPILIEVILALGSCLPAKLSALTRQHFLMRECCIIQL